MKDLIFAIFAIFALSAVFSPGVFADGRLEIDAGANTAHIPYDATNTDREFKIAATTASAIENPDGSYSAWYADVTWIPSAITLPGPQKIVVKGIDTGEDCTVSVDGTEYTTNDWTATIRRLTPSQIARSIVCLNAT